MKKLIPLLLAMCICLTLTALLTGCNGSSGNNGTYYLFDNGSTDKNSWVKIEDSKWSDSDGMSGTFKLEGEDIYFYVNLDGQEELLLDGTLRDGKLTIDGGIVYIVYYLDGKAPDNDNTENSAGDDTNEGELEFTLIDETDTYALTGLGTFNGTRLEIPSEYNGKAVTAISGTWDVNRTIKEIIIPDSVTVIGMRNGGTTGMFEYFTALEYIDFGNGIETIPKKVCNGVKTLKTIVIGSNVTLIDEEAFDNTGIVTLTIPEGVTRIGFSAFHQCEKLETVNLPSSLTFIGVSAFQSCKVLKTVNFAGTEDQFFYNVSKDKTSFQRCPEDLQLVYEK